MDDNDFFEIYRNMVDISQNKASKSKVNTNQIRKRLNDTKKQLEYHNPYRNPM